MSEIVIGISDLKVSSDPRDALVTYALGSCVAVAIYDPATRVGGLLHYMLPESALDPERAKGTPGMFADSGIPMLFRACYQLGADKRRMIVKAAGGASILDDTNYFRIGQKNVMAMRKIFWRNNVLINAEDTGGHFNRTVRLNIADGRMIVKTAGNSVKDI